MFASRGRVSLMKRIDKLTLRSSRQVWGRFFSWLIWQKWARIGLQMNVSIQKWPIFQRNEKGKEGRKNKQSKEGSLFTQQGLPVTASVCGVLRGTTAFTRPVSLIVKYRTLYLYQFVSIVFLNKSSVFVVPLVFTDKSFTSLLFSGQTFDFWKPHF